MRILASLLVLLPAGEAWARESYEAQPGLLPLSGFILFYKTEAPLSSLPMTGSEVPGYAVPGEEVRATSCQHGLSVPLSASVGSNSISGAIGKGGYGKALAVIRDEHPDLLGIYDVRVDQHVFSILGIYKRLCIEVTARGLVPRPEKDSSHEKIPSDLLER